MSLTCTQYVVDILFQLILLRGLHPEDFSLLLGSSLLITATSIYYFFTIQDSYRSFAGNGNQ